MTDTVMKVLNEFEDMVKAGEISSFSVFVLTYGVRFKSQNGEKQEEVILPVEVLQTLESFFFDLDGIRYRSLDYTNLKSLLNARVMLDKLCGKNNES